RFGSFASTSSYHCASTTPQSVGQRRIRPPPAAEWVVRADARSTYPDLTRPAEWVIGGSLRVTGNATAAAADVSVRGPQAYERALVETTLLSALDPGTYTVTAGHVQLDGSVYVATPASQQVKVGPGEQVDAEVTYAVNTDGLNFDVLQVHLTQSVQRFDGSIPLVEGRDA